MPSRCFCYCRFTAEDQAKDHSYCQDTINPFPNKPCFLRVCSTSLLKTQWEKEKLLLTSNFSFSHIVFYPFGELFLPFSSNSKLSPANSFSLGEPKICRFGKGLNLDQKILKYGEYCYCMVVPSISRWQKDEIQSQASLKKK